MSSCWTTMDSRPLPERISCRARTAALPGSACLAGCTRGKASLPQMASLEVVGSARREQVVRRPGGHGGSGGRQRADGVLKEPGSVLGLGVEHKSHGKPIGGANEPGRAAADQCARV